jgi:hypothetical protein
LAQFKVLVNVARLVSVPAGVMEKIDPLGVRPAVGVPPELVVP